MRPGVLLAVVAMVGCKKSAPEERAAPPKPLDEKPAPTASDTGKPVAPGTLRVKHVGTTYFVLAPKTTDIKALEKDGKAKLPGATVKTTTLDDVLPADQREFLLREFAPADATGVEASNVLGFSSEGDDPVALARTLSSAVAAAADASHGWVYDPSVWQIYSAADFHKHIPGDKLDVRALISVHGVGGDNEMPFLDTAGLRRYGFPELYMRDVPPSNVRDINHLLNAVAQALMNGQDVDSKGQITVDIKALGWDVGLIDPGTGKATLRATWAREPDAHDDDLPVIELAPLDGAGSEHISKLVNDTFGAVHDGTVEVKADDPELLAAAAKARADLQTLRTHFKAGIPADETLTIKTRFTDGDIVEWMWVDVVAFKGDTLEGTLANTPELVHNLKEGGKVKVKLGDVADYMHERKGEQIGGGYSVEVFKKRGMYP